jgi:alpha-tubulin suppressor-like RCC1 family protein
VKLGAVTAGHGHTCARTTTGGVQCWGFDAYGQLGDGASADSPLPVAVSGLSSDVTAISAGLEHTCALTAAGGVLCWGNNSADGQLGNGSTADSHVPVAVAGLSSGVTAISAGQVHTCALTAGGVQCWGYDGDGQLGNGSTADSHVPVAVAGLSSGVTSVAAGGLHTCAVTKGGVQCWGYDGDGQLGNGSTANSHVPVAVAGLSSGVASVATGFDYTCALTTAGAVLCWGNNEFGQLGDGSAVGSEVPIAVSGLSSGVAAVATGDGHACALTTAGGVLCWGYGMDGELGNGSAAQSLVPVAVSGLSSGVAAIAVGGTHACALTTAGAVRCWGENMNGQLGDGSTTQSLVPVAVIEPWQSTPTLRIRSGARASPFRSRGERMRDQCGSCATRSSPPCPARCRRRTRSRRASRRPLGDRSPGARCANPPLMDAFLSRSELPWSRRLVATFAMVPWAWAAWNSLYCPGPGEWAPLVFLATASILLHSAHPLAQLAVRAVLGATLLFGLTHFHWDHGWNLRAHFDDHDFGVLAAGGAAVALGGAGLVTGPARHAFAPVAFRRTLLASVLGALVQVVFLSLVALGDAGARHPRRVVLDVALAAAAGLGAAGSYRLRAWGPLLTWLIMAGFATLVALDLAHERVAGVVVLDLTHWLPGMGTVLLAAAVAQLVLTAPLIVAILRGMTDGRPR